MTSSAGGVPTRRPPEVPAPAARRTLADGEYEALADFRYALRLFVRFSEDAARAEGLTPNQHQLLLAVRANPEPLGVAEIAQRLQLKPNSALELLRRAEASDMVSLRTDEDDHRRQLVSLAPEGHKRLERLSELHRDELRRFRSEASDLLAELG